MAGIDINVYQDLLLRYDRGAIEGAIWDFGPEFRSHLPSEKVSRGLPEQDWTTQWEKEHEANQPQQGNGRAESK